MKKLAYLGLKMAKHELGGLLWRAPPTENFPAGVPSLCMPKLLLPSPSPIMLMIMLTCVTSEMLVVLQVVEKGLAAT